MCLSYPFPAGNDPYFRTRTNSRWYRCTSVLVLLFCLLSPSVHADQASAPLSLSGELAVVLLLFAVLLVGGGWYWSLKRVEQRTRELSDALALLDRLLTEMEAA